MLEPTNSSPDQLINEYLDFKWSYLQQHCENCKNINELFKEDETYNEHDWVNLEPIKWEDPGVIWFLEPAIRKSYFVLQVLEWFNPKTQKFTTIKTNKTEIDTNSFEQVFSNYKVNWKKWTMYVLPLSKDLKIIWYDNTKVKVFQDKYGKYFVKFLIDGSAELAIWYNTEENNFHTENTEKIIYTWNKIDLSQFKDRYELKKYIKNKKYKNVSQRQFHWNDTNEYIENLFNSQEMDCLPANVLFTALARSLGYKTRLITWYQTYIKDEKTYISLNKGHAWSEIFVDGRWLRVDATPTNTDEQQNEEQDLDNLIENISEWDWNGTLSDKFEIKKWNETLSDNFEIKKWKEEVANLLDKIPNIESKYFSSALEYVRQDAEDIIFYIQNLLQQRREFLRKSKLRWKPKRRKQWQAWWKLKITPNSISRLAVWDPRIFEQNKKLKYKSDEDIDTRLKDISVAIDVSGSMWTLSWDWKRWTKLDNAYLSVVLLYVVSKGLDINFDTAVLFADEIVSWSPEKVLKKLEHISWGWNSANTIWIKEAINSIKNTTKWITFVISDWDSGTWTAFFDKESSNFLKQNKNLFVVWYGIWKDATSQLTWKTKLWKTPTVIESRMEEAWNEQSKWFNVKIYTNLVEQFKKHLESFMTGAIRL